MTYHSQFKKKMFNVCQVHHNLFCVQKQEDSRGICTKQLNLACAEIFLVISSLFFIPVRQKCGLVNLLLRFLNHCCVWQNVTDALPPIFALLKYFSEQETELILSNLRVPFSSLNFRVLEKQSPQIGCQVSLSCQ